MAGLRGLAAKLFSRESIAKEFDPETDEPIDDGDSQNGGRDSGSESSEDDTKDTEHYVQVGKSKLRQKQPVTLGPEYRGVRVSRAQIEQESEEDEEDEEEDDEDDDDDDDEEFDDPDDADPEADDIVDSEDEIDSDDAFGSDDEALKKKFTFRGSSKPRVAKKRGESEEEDEEEEEDDEDDEDGSNDNSEEEDEDEDEEDGSEDGSEEEEEDDDDDEDEDETTAKTLEQARKLMAQDQKRVVSSLSASAKADADKGFAVRQQRRAFDALLNVRIRMQKALVSANSLHAAGTEDASAAVDSSVADDAEAKAIKLLNTIHSIRQSFHGGAEGGSATKRKRAEDNSNDDDDDDDDDDDVDVSVTCETLFDRMVQAEEVAVAKRRRVLDRWSQRVQRPGAAGAMARRSGGAASGGTQALVDLLEGQLATPDRLIRRTQTPRSCAPVQVAKRVQADPEIYDDADFYQLLLKELVDQRAADDASAPGGDGGNGAATVRWATAAAKEAKTRKLVDRRASKGRKMRFNVHEQLQNFMAPEDRRTWEPEAVDRLFSTLFGQRLELREVDGDGDQDEGGVSLEEESLRLFRN